MLKNGKARNIEVIKVCERTYAHQVLAIKLLLVIFVILTALFGTLLGTGKAFSDDTNSEAKNLIKQAGDLKRDNKDDKAALLYERAMALDPNSLDSFDYLALTDCYINLDQANRAVEVLKAGISTKISSRDTGSYLLVEKLAAIYQDKLGQSADAISVLLEKAPLIHAIENSGDSYPSFNMYMNAADIYKEEKKYSEALSIYESQDEGKGNYPEWYEGISDCYERMGDIEKAINIYLSALDIEFVPEISTALAELLIRNGRYDEAEAQLTKEIDLVQEAQPKELIYVYNLLLTVYEKEGKSQEAIDSVNAKISEQEKKYQESTLAARKKSTNGRLILLIICVVGLTLLIITVLLLRRRKKRKNLGGHVKDSAGISLRLLSLQFSHRILIWITILK